MPPPPPTPIFPDVTGNAVQLSASGAQLDIGSNFLQRLGRQATWGYAQRDNSAGGGAPESAATQSYRAWVEGYGSTSRTSAQGTFVGDERRTWGGVAGLGMTLAPGFTAGLSVDQSRTRIDVPLALQSADLDLTQIGINAAYVSGPWTLAFAAVHGFAAIDARRATITGPALSAYGGRIDGALGEISYYQAFGQSRIVPKLGLEYVVAKTDAFQEFGGFEPVSVADAHAERARLLAGAEIGHYWIVGQQIVDVSAYGKFVDNFTQNVSAVQVSLGANSIAVQGIRESMYGADAGAGLSWIISRTARLYANYDGKFRDGFTSHQGTLGLELKW
ncbi:autotransporter outer membrane beta-barrel domain-containing protein [Afipia sp. TerB]